MRGLLGDCQHALRLYRSTPGASLIAAVLLAVSIAFVGAFFALYADLALRPTPGFNRGADIATVGWTSGTELVALPYDTVDRLAEEMTTVEAAAIPRYARLPLGTQRDLMLTVQVTKGFFPGLEPRLALGRGFRDEDHAPDAEPVVVLSYRFWQERYGGDRNVLDSFLEIRPNPDEEYLKRNAPSSGEPPPEPVRFRIVGVMSQELATLPGRGSEWERGHEWEPVVWLPLERVWPMFHGEPEILAQTIPLSTYVRRAPRASVAAVANELRARYDNASASQGSSGARLDAISGLVFDIGIELEARRQLELLLLGSVLLAIAAGANVSLFLLARAPARRRELGIRQAVGASVGRLGRQLATEAGLLLIAATLAGLTSSVWLSFALRHLPTLRDARWHEVTLLDWRVLAFVAALIVVLGLVVSLAPILGLKRVGIAEAARSALARASPAQRLVGAAQITVAGVLAAAAIAFGWHLGLIVFGDAGYETADRYFVQELGRGGANSAEGRHIARERRREIVEALPGVSAVAYGYPIPATVEYSTSREAADPRDWSRMVRLRRGLIEPRLIDVLGLELLHGRAPEGNESGVVVLNQSAARAIFGRDDVVGERLTTSVESQGFEIVGVLKDLSYGHPLADARPYVLEPLGYLPTTYIHAVIQAALSAAELQQALDQLIRDGALDVETLTVRPLAAMRSEKFAADRVRGTFAIAAATLVVLLSGFGFYGIQRYLVAAGRREYAIRASLGAGPSALGRLVAYRGVLLALPGLVLGGLLAFIVVAWLRFDRVSGNVSPAQVTITVLSGLIVLLLVASFGPALEARRTEPGPLLRED